MSAHLEVIGGENCRAHSETFSLPYTSERDLVAKLRDALMEREEWLTPRALAEREGLKTGTLHARLYRWLASGAVVFGPEDAVRGATGRLVRFRMTPELRLMMDHLRTETRQTPRIGPGPHWRTPADVREAYGFASAQFSRLLHIFRRYYGKGAAPTMPRRPGGVQTWKLQVTPEFHHYLLKARNRP